MSRSNKAEDYRGLWEYYKKMSEFGTASILDLMLTRLEWLKSKQTYDEYREVLRKKRLACIIALQKKNAQVYVKMKPEYFRRCLYPARHGFTTHHKYALDHGMEIYRVDAMRPNDGLWVRAVGPFGAIVEEYRGYPLLLLASFRTFKYEMNEKAGKYIAKECELTRQQWDRLYRTCSLFKCVDYKH